MFLIGSFLFCGQFHLKPASATVTPQNSNLSSPLEEKSNTEGEKKGKEKTNRKKNKNYDEVLEMYERFLEKNPMDREALKIVLYGKLRKEKIEEALKFIKKLVMGPFLLYHLSNSVPVRYSNEIVPTVHNTKVPKLDTVTGTLYVIIILVSCMSGQVPVHT